ncbi:MAG: matrixin family metalloprotease [Candidatus Paceibacterota bacterium]
MASLSRTVSGLLVFFMITIIVAGILYRLQTKPCAAPLTYRIGSFDENFGISKKDFLAALEQSSAVWSTSVGKNLFMYDPKGDLTVNLIYDERQKVTQQNLELQADVKKTGELAGSIKEEYTKLEADLAVSKEAYASDLARFESDQNAYQTQVEYWNNQGGAPAAEYQKLVALQRELETKQSYLESKRLALNAQVDQVNAFIQKYNLLVRDANVRIGTINARAGKEFQEGTYDPSTRTINIYEFSTQYKLLRILAHEFGHALSLDHNTNPLSIMYELNTANTLTLSNEDIQSLKTVCSLP